jgi:enterochelin esterase-like enzyme
MKTPLASLLFVVVAGASLAQPAPTPPAANPATPNAAQPGASSSAPAAPAAGQRGARRGGGGGGNPARLPNVPGSPLLIPAGPGAEAAARARLSSKTPVLADETSDTKAQGAPGANPPLVDGDFLVGPTYVRAPELTVVPGVPQGKVAQFSMSSTDSKFYNPGIARNVFGTVDPNNPKTLIVDIHNITYQRTITVYIPAQYVPGTAAPFIVTHDGPGMGRPDMSLPHILDNMIAQHRVPAMIAIMVSHGGGDAQGSERGLEYDTMSGKYAEFIEAEVLPLVEKNYNVKLTKDPEGRATMGGSSGGSAALEMAWYHPDLYHRVLTYSGTYVNQQWPFNPETPDGAWDFHEKLIPNSDPKPIRIWMETGDKDLLNPNIMRDNMHDWVVANRHMAVELKKKGYHYQFVYALNAGHVDGPTKNQTLPEALEWLWQGYPIAPDAAPAKDANDL